MLNLSLIHISAQQQTDPEQKATVQTQGDSIIIRKGKGDMRIKVYEEQLEDGEKKEVWKKSNPESVLPSKAVRILTLISIVYDVHN